jgi:probable addiction module antidote protein
MIKARTWDVTRDLDTEEKAAAFLEDICESGDPRLIAAAIGEVARARGMTQIAREAGLSRESLYKALSEEGNPEFATIMKVIKALGYDMALTPHKPTAAE